MRLDNLPKIDANGNYWYGVPGSCCPAIFPVRGEWKHRQKYFVSLGHRGVLFDQGSFLLFDTPEDAHNEIRRRMGKSD